MTYLPNLNMITAMTTDYLIGDGDRLPWKGFKEDLETFFSTISGKRIIVGTKTFLGLPKAAVERIELYNPIHLFDGKEHSLENILNEVKDRPLEEFWVIGGAETYRQFLPHTYRIRMTLILNSDIKAEQPVYFPMWGEYQKFKSRFITELKDKERGYVAELIDYWRIS